MIHPSTIGCASPQAVDDSQDPDEVAEVGGCILAHSMGGSRPRWRTQLLSTTAAFHQHAPTAVRLVAIAVTALRHIRTSATTGTFGLNDDSGAQNNAHAVCIGSKLFFANGALLQAWGRPSRPLVSCILTIGHLRTRGRCWSCRRMSYTTGALPSVTQNVPYPLGQVTVSFVWSICHEALLHLHFCWALLATFGNHVLYFAAGVHCAPQASEVD